MAQYFGLIEALGTGAIVLGFCAWQWWTTRPAARARDSAEDARHAEGEHELHDR